MFFSSSSPSVCTVQFVQKSALAPLWGEVHFLNYIMMIVVIEINSKRAHIVLCAEKA